MKILVCSCLLTLSLILFLSACTGTEGSTEIWFTQRDPEGHKIVALNPATRLQRTIVRLKPGEFLADASLSPDGRKILYVSYRAQNPEVWLANSDGSNPTRVGLDFEEKGFVWLDNDRILFTGLKINWTAYPDDPFQWKVYDLRSRQVQPLIWKGLTIPPPDHLSRSHYQVYIRRIPEASLVEETSVVFYGHIEIENDVVQVIMDVQVDPLQLPRGLGSPGSATADGRIIVFHGRGGINNNDVFVASDYGHSVRQLTSFRESYGVSGIGQLAISPNGKWVIFQGSLGLPHTPNLPTGGQIVLVSTDGKTLKFLREDKGGIYGRLVWSADSRYVAICVVPQGADPNNSSGEIHLIDIETGEIKQLTSDGWSKEVFDWR
jgi:hypothetical protein